MKASILKSLPTKLTQINQGIPYDIVMNSEKVLPNLQILCSSAYQKIIFQKYKVKYCPWLGL